MFVSRTQPTVRKRCDSKYFLGDLQWLFFFWLPEIVTRSSICSIIYVRNWFTLLNEQNPLLNFEGTRFVNELWKEKKKSPYLPTHRWNGGSGAGNEHILKGGLRYAWYSLYIKLIWVSICWGTIAQQEQFHFFYISMGITLKILNEKLWFSILSEILSIYSMYIHQFGLSLLRN